MALTVLQDTILAHMSDPERCTAPDLSRSAIVRGALDSSRSWRSKLLTPRMSDLTDLHEVIQSLEGTSEIHPRAGPVDEIEIHVVCRQTTQACFARLKNAVVSQGGRAPLLWQGTPAARSIRDFAEGASEQLLAVAGGVRLGSVKVSVAKIEGGPQRPQVIGVAPRLRPPAATDIPGSKSYLGKAKALKRFVLHFRRAHVACATRLKAEASEPSCGSPHVPGRRKLLRQAASGSRAGAPRMFLGSRSLCRAGM